MGSETGVARDQTGGRLAEFEALQTIIAAIRDLDEEARRRILDSAATFLGVTLGARQPIASSAPHQISSSSRAPFSEDSSMSPKDFIMEKAPKTDVERIACLAYYLTHYRSTQHFKTLDLSLLNTEAAQSKFSNTAYSSNNAVKLGYLVPSLKGQRQISALGERFVQALPDRAAAKEVLTSLRRRLRAKRKRNHSEEVAQE
jgi:hypothetical protein